MTNLNHFQGKVCTILTSPVNRHFLDESQYANTFVGIVEKIDDFGVWLIQIAAKKKSFFTLKSIVGIIEETVQPFSEEEAQQVRKQIEARLPPKNNQQLISVDSLKKIRDKNEKSSS